MNRKILIILFVIIQCFFIGISCNSNNETIGIRNIYIESSNYDLAYIKNKYSIYINNDNFEINEIYNDSNSIIAKNSLENDIQIYYNAYVNIKEQYFIFSYTLYNNNEIILSSNVSVSVIEYENTHYFISNNGSFIPCCEVISMFNIGKCAAFSYKCYDDVLGMNLLLGEKVIGGAAISLGTAVGTMAGAAIYAQINNNSKNYLTGGSSATMSGALSGGMIPNNNNDSNSNKSEEEKVKSISDDIPNKYKQNYKCNEYADLLQSSMEKNNIPGERIQINSHTGYIYSDEFGTISTNSKHVGIRVNNTIFDNLHPNGISYSDWLSDIGYYENPQMFEIIKSLF